MAHPLVVHNKVDPFEVYIGRPGKWGNPIFLKNSRDDIERAKVLAEYKRWLARDSELVQKYGEPPTQEEIKAELRGKVLGCWCAPRDCHGDVLAEIANAR